MLNRARILKELQEQKDNIFLAPQINVDFIRAWWNHLCNDPLFMYKARHASSAWLIPHWQEPLGDAIVVPHPMERYRVLGVDGSQVYPDRHQGTSCFLVNIGTVALGYATEGKAIHLDSQPYLYTGVEDELITADSHELVNCRRQELEFSIGLQQSSAIKKQYPDDPFLFLFDGSLIFWHLESKDPVLKEFFLHRYLVALDQFYQAGIPLAGYISLPKSKELVNLIKLGITNGNAQSTDPELAQLDSVVDATVARLYLDGYTRSIVFKNNAAITSLYPPHNAPHFFYLDVETEIVRIELPAWVAQKPDLLEMVARIIVDQAIKGRGYPVALAEAHEQAVVKGPDRDFFYHLITKMAIEHKHQITISQKSMKKRRMGI